MEKNKVAIILCTYNGEKFLREQVDSIISQTHDDWVVYFSDDGSSDNTLDIINEYQEKLSDEKIKLVNGPNKGFAWNFISALQQIPDCYSYYAFCDQDDIWKENKLEKAVRKLSNNSADVPELYCGRTTLIDEKGWVIGMSPLFLKKPSFKNALVQSIAGGNTMVLNHAAKLLIEKTPKYKKIVSHDWWIYMLITGMQGFVYYDTEPAILYRQHGNNIIGANNSFSARLYRIRKLFDGQLREWSNANIKLMDYFSDELKEKEDFNLFKKTHDCGIVERLRSFMKAGLYRQTSPGTIALIIAVILKKI